LIALTFGAYFLSRRSFAEPKIIFAKEPSISTTSLKKPLQQPEAAGTSRQSV
jgi:hypothetical protein